MKTILFEFFGDYARDAFLKLESGKIIDIVAWIGTSGDNNVVNCSYGQMFNPAFLSRYYKICPQEIYDQVYKKLYVFIDMQQRMRALPAYEHLNDFNMWINFYYGLFTETGAELIIFPDVPHFGIDSIAAYLASEMGLKTVYLLQSPIASNCFWAMTNKEDIGIFDSLNNEMDEILDDELIFEPESYVKSIVWKQDKPYGDYIFDIDDILVSLEKSKKEKDKLAKGRNYREIARIMRMAATELIYEEESKQMGLKSSVDLTKKYVYFPLHLQPEQTTSAFGEEYCDQLLALERLAEQIPNDWVIYLKENPRQSFYMRESYFFKRLSLLRNVIYVNPNVSTHDLIEHSQFVATICGTAGWEALLTGKCVLVFGLAWYRKLPGVFEYNQGRIHIDDIMTYHINREILLKEYRKLHKKGYKGVIAEGYGSRVNNYSNKSNCELFYNAFLKILNAIGN